MDYGSGKSPMDERVKNNNEIQEELPEDKETRNYYLQIQSQRQTYKQVCEYELQNLRK